MLYGENEYFGDCVDDYQHVIKRRGETAKVISMVCELYKLTYKVIYWLQAILYLLAFTKSPSEQSLKTRFSIIRTITKRTLTVSDGKRSENYRKNLHVKKS